jgi:hypothetical protein
VARDLETDVRKFERAAALAAARVLGADEFLKDIEVRGLETGAEQAPKRAAAAASAQTTRELADLRDDPAEDVAGQTSTKASGRSRERSNYGAPAGKATMCCEVLGTLLVLIA